MTEMIPESVEIPTFSPDIAETVLVTEQNLKWAANKTGWPENVLKTMLAASKKTQTPCIASIRPERTAGL